MAELVAIVPSRGRPEAARTVAAAFKATCTAATSLVFAVDADDPRLGDYLSPPPGTPGLCAITVISQQASSMVEALNMFAMRRLRVAPPFAVAFMGDDHLPRTVGWDEKYLTALHDLGTGIVYGDDLLQGRDLPTQCAMTSDIIRALGYMAPPALTHLYVDNFWLSLGNKAGCIRYLPDVIVEHRHPAAGKAAIDAGYERVNSSAMYDRDEAAWLAYIESGEFNGAVAKVAALRGAHV